MNATTTTTIGGVRRELVFGRRYVLAHRNGAAHEVILSGRRRNGDLEITDNETTSVTGIRVADIVDLTAVPDDVRDVETDAGQQALETAAAAARAARRDTARAYRERPVRRSAGQMLESLGTEAGVLGVLDELVSGARHQTTRERIATVRAERDAAAAKALLGVVPAAAALESDAYDGAGEPRVKRKLELDEAGEVRVPAAAPEARRSPRKARAVSEPVSAPAGRKNRLWRCPACKVRTRLESCPRDATPAPAGKRAAS